MNLGYEGNVRNKGVYTIYWSAGRTKACLDGPGKSNYWLTGLTKMKNGDLVYMGKKSKK